MGYSRPIVSPTNHSPPFGNTPAFDVVEDSNKSARAASFDCQNTRRSFWRLKNYRGPKAQCPTPHDFREDLLHEFFKDTPTAAMISVSEL